MSLSNRQSQLIEALAQMLLRTFIQGEITFWVGKLQIMAGPPPPLQNKAFIGHTLY